MALEESCLRDGELESAVMPEYVSEVHGVGSPHVESAQQSFLEAIDALENETDVVVFLGIGCGVCTEPFLVGCQSAIFERF